MTGEPDPNQETIPVDSSQSQPTPESGPVLGAPTTPAPPGGGDGEPPEDPQKILDWVKADIGGAMKYWITHPFLFTWRFAPFWTMKNGLMIIAAFALIGALIGLIGGILSFNIVTIIAAAFGAVVSMVVAIVGALVFMLIIHIVAKLFGGEGSYGTMVGAYGVIQAQLLPYYAIGWVISLLASIPFIGFIFAICLFPVTLLVGLAQFVHWIFFLIAALQNVYGLDMVKSIFVLVISVAIIAVMIVILFVILVILLIIIGISLLSGIAPIPGL